MQKAKLVEQVALLMDEKKLPLLADVRDESSELVRLVFEPKSRTVEPAMLMETLFRYTQLESRFPLNMNVLTADRVPQVLGLRAVLQAWLDHRHEVLIRVSRHRQAAIERRLEILDGYLAVFLNLDEVIRIIREADEPKPALMTRFDLSDLQAESILNMRLRSLRRLEEIEIRKEHAALSKELTDLKALLSDDRQRWRRISDEIGKNARSVRKSTARHAADAAGSGADTDGGEQRGVRRARGDHCHFVGQRLGAGGARRGDQSGRFEIQGRRQIAPAGGVRDDGSAVSVRHQWAGAHAAGR